MLQQECYTWSKRISCHWAFWQFCFARLGTPWGVTGNLGKRVLLCMYENMQRSQLITGALKGPWPAYPPSNYVYLRCMSVPAMLGDFLVFGHVIMVLGCEQNKRMPKIQELKYKYFTLILEADNLSDIHLKYELFTDMVVPAFVFANMHWCENFYFTE